MEAVLYRDAKGQQVEDGPCSSRKTMNCYTTSPGLHRALCPDYEEQMGVIRNMLYQRL